MQEITVSRVYNLARILSGSSSGEKTQHVFCGAGRQANVVENDTIGFRMIL